MTEEERKQPPAILTRAEYWPEGPGTDQLEGRIFEKKKPNLRRHGQQADLELSNGTHVADAGPALARRDDGPRREDVETLELGDEGYPYAYDIDDMYEWYKDVAY